MKSIFIKSIISMCLSVFSCQLFSQNNSVKKDSSDKMYGVWASPSKATHVYGLMFNLWNRDHGPYPKIYGAELNICPIGVFAPFLVALYSLDIPKTLNRTDDMIYPADYNNFKKVNGLEISLMNIEPTVINGLDLNASGSFESVTNGITISVAANNHYLVNGITIAAIANSDYKCNGVQIAMVNSCKELKGFQFGLWNKNQKRSFPFINWALKL